MAWIDTQPIGRIYDALVAKLARKERSQAELDAVIEWLLGYDRAAVQANIAAGSSVAEFYSGGTLNPLAQQITGRICGVRVEEITDPLMQRIRYLDKMVDELYQGKALEVVLRTPAG